MHRRGFLKSTGAAGVGLRSAVALPPHLDRLAGQGKGDEGGRAGRIMGEPVALPAHGVDDDNRFAWNKRCGTNC